jgi:hypothetical protein
MRDSTWVVIDAGDTWFVQPQDGGSVIDLSTVGLYSVSLGVGDGGSIIDEAEIGAFVIGDIT